MSELVIKKNTNLTFTFILDGDTDNAVIDNQPNMTSTGIYFNFKTKNGANIIKKQFIQYSQITYKDISDTEFTFLTIQEVWTKLINEGFFDYLGATGGGGGVTRFDELDDTFSYTGNDGKVVVVNQSELKLDPVTFYNFKDFIQLEDVAISELIVDKIVSVASVSGVPKLVLTDAPSDPVQLANVMGYFDYNDLETHTTSLTLVSGVDKKLTNDTLGAFTDISQSPYGVSSIWNTDTNSYDFNELTIGDTIDVRFDIQVTTTSANQRVRAFLRIGEGSVGEYDLPFVDKTFKTAGNYQIVQSLPIYIGSEIYRINPASYFVNTDSSGTCIVNGWFNRIIRKGINIVDIDLVVDEAISTDDFNEIVLGSDGKLFTGNLIKEQYSLNYSYSTGTTNAVFPLRENGASNYVLTSGSLSTVSGFDLSLIVTGVKYPYLNKLIRVYNQTGNDIILKQFDDTNAEIPFSLKDGVDLTFPNNEIIEFSFSPTELTETFRSWATTSSDSFITVISASTSNSETVTGTTAATVAVADVLIPANTVTVGSILTIKIRLQRTVVTSSNTNFYGCISPTISDTAANLIGANKKYTQNNIQTTNQYIQVEHDIHVKTSVLSESFLANASIFSDNSTGVTQSSNNTDWSVDQYFNIVVSNAQTTTGTIIKGYELILKK